MDRQERKIFEYLKADCGEESIPVPQAIWSVDADLETVGVFMRLLAFAWDGMLWTDGKSGWECNAANLLVPKSEAERLTRNRLRKLLMRCQAVDYIEYAKEKGDEIIVKINVKHLFQGLVKEQALTK